MITFPRKNNYDRKSVEYFRPITLFNTELQILVKILTIHLQIVENKLNDPNRHTRIVKRSTTQENFHLVRTILDEKDDGTGAALVNIDQSKPFNTVDHRFLEATLVVAGFDEGFSNRQSSLFHPCSMASCWNSSS